MQNVAFILLRRLRLPLILLVLSYALSVLGMTLVPGRDADGKLWYMDFFHAFYFISFLGTTIGLGEIPYPFSDAQRMWATVSIYITVVCWLYGIGALLSVIQDPAFRRLAAQRRFALSVRRLNEPFYLICGYGETGSSVVGVLAEHGLRAVVLDVQQTRIESLELDELRVEVPGLCADASDPAALQMAGINKPQCMGVIALTNVDRVNLTVAISSKLLAPQLPVICRAEHHETALNMDSFGTDHIINPFDTFANRFAIAIQSPATYQLHEWFSFHHAHYRVGRIQPPRGKWLLCGYGRFGKAMHDAMGFEGQEMTVIEYTPLVTHSPSGTVQGRGTEADTLRLAGIQEAVGVIAGTDDDSNNLSIIMTARELRPDLFVVARQSERRNEIIFNAAHPDVIMQPSAIIAGKVLALIDNPLLADFLRMIRQQDEAWARQLVNRLSEVLEGQELRSWVLDVSPSVSMALCDVLTTGEQVSLGQLYRSMRDAESVLPCVPLVLKRGGECQLLPADDVLLAVDDLVLFGGTAQAESELEWVTRNRNVLDYVRSGVEQPRSAVLRKLSRQSPRPG